MVKKSFFLMFLVLSVLGCQKKESLTVVSYGGGAYQKSHIDSFFKPFEKDTGIHIEPIVWNAEYGKLKEMVESKLVPWDIVEVTDAEFKRGKKDNLFQALQPTLNKNDFLPNTIDNFGVANVYWGTVLAYSKDAFPSKSPQSWKDFWNIKEFPGDRALCDDPRGTLEFALLADGVDKNNLYPIDIERAFRKLDQIKPYVRIWWKEGTQPVQILQNKSVVMTSAWSGRIFALGEQSKIGYIWKGAALELDWWVIPQGSKHSVTSAKFIEYASTPERMATQAKLIGYGPVNTKALPLLADGIQSQIPTYTKNWDESFVVNSDWWAQNEVEIMKKWAEWKIK